MLLLLRPIMALNGDAERGVDAPPSGALLWSVPVGVRSLLRSLPKAFEPLLTEGVEGCAAI